MPSPEVRILSNISPNFPQAPIYHAAGKPLRIPSQGQKAQADTLNYALINSFGDTIPTGVPISIKGKTLAVVSPKPIPAQEPSMKSKARFDIQYWNRNNGLHDSFFYDLAFDSSGYLWLASRGEGLIKFDGSSFFNFKKFQDLDIGPSIINNLLIDKHNHIWIVTRHSGIIRFDGTQATQFSEPQGLPTQDIQDVMEDKEGNLWFLLWNKGIAKYDGKNFTFYSLKEGMSELRNWKIMEDSQGNIWLGTYKNGISKFDGESFTHYSEEQGLAGRIAFSLLEDKEGNIWIGTQKGLSKFDGQAFYNYTEQEGLSHSYVRTLYEDKQGNLWVGTYGGGLNKFDGQTFTHFTTREGLSDNSVNQILEDAHGNIWIASNVGLNRFNPSSFIHFNEDFGLKASIIQAVHEDHKGDLWLSSFNQGIFKFDGTSFTSYEETIARFCHDIITDKKGNTWFGTNGGLFKLAGQQLTHYTPQQGLSNIIVVSLLEDSQGNIWIGTRAGINKFDGEAFTQYTSQEGLPGDYINNILEDKLGNIWFSVRKKSLSKFDGAYFTHYTPQEGMSSTFVLSMAQDPRGDIWLGTNGNGLSKFDGQQFTHYTEADGLAGEVIVSLSADSTGNIWLGTLAGLNYMQCKSQATSSDSVKFIHFSQSDGLAGLDYNHTAVYEDSQKQLWWGHTKGLTRMNKNQIRIPTRQYPPQLTRLDLDEQFLDFRNLPKDLQKQIQFTDIAPFENIPQNLSLSHRINHLSFYFAAPDLDTPHHLRYSFRLKGLDNNWSTASSQNFADYRNIPYGTFTFQVRAMGASKIWSDPYEYTFTISYPWWLSYWALLSYMLVGLVMIVVIVKLRTYHLVKKQKELEELVDIRTAELQKSNQEITSQRDQLQKTIKQLKQAQAQLIHSEKMSSLGQLTAGIAHEINNPINFIKANIETLQENLQDIAKVVHPLGELNSENYLEKLKQIQALKEAHQFDLAIQEIETLLHGIGEGALRTMGIVQGLRTFSRLDEAAYKVTNIHENLDATLTLLYNRYKERIQLVKDYKAQGTLEAYPGKLNQMFMNLITNAIDAIETEGSINICTRDLSDGNLLVTIQDSGVGISEDTKPHIFEPFFTTKPVGQGVGLGLSIVHTIIQNHRGQIQVESEPGKGSTFEVILPTRHF